MHHAETDERHILPDDKSKLFMLCGNPRDCIYSALLVYSPEPVYVYTSTQNDIFVPLVFFNCMLHRHFAAHTVYSIQTILKCLVLILTKGVARTLKLHRFNINFLRKIVNIFEPVSFNIIMLWVLKIIVSFRRFF